MKRLPSLAASLIVGVFAGVTTATAQTVADHVPEPVRGQQFELSIRSIMRAESNVGVAPREIRWTDDSEWVYFSWRPGGLDWDAPRSSYRVSARGGTPEMVDDDTMRQMAPLLANGDLSADRRWRISSVRGDLYLVDRRSMRVRRLTHTQDGEGQPLFGSDGESILFQRDGNLFRLTIESGELTQLTRMASEPEPSDPPEAEGQRGFLENQQLELFAHIRRDVAQSERRDSVREANTARLLPQIRLAPEERLRALTPTRSGEYALIHAGRPSEGSKETIVPDWITADGYTRDLTVRSKVGDAQSSRRVGILTTATGAVSWIDLVPEDYEGEGSVRVGRGSGPPGSSVSGANWNDAGTKAFVFAVSFDDKDRWLWSVDAATGERTLVDHLHDDAWVAGPCFTECVGFVPGTDRIYFVSEETGYAHLYSVNADGSDRRALTSGEWEVLSVSMPEDRSRFFLRTNEGSPFSEHLFWMDFDGSHRERITEGEGRFNGTLSPDGKRLAIVHDVADRPQELFVADSDDAAEMSQVTDSPTEEWKSFPWIKPEILRFEAEDGTMVPARIYRPEDLGAEPHGGAVIFVHGAGYLHNVHNYWSSYYREYQFNQFLAASGYTVLDIDYRGSAGYGSEWRTGIYRWMGGKDLSDQVDGARYLAANEGIDAERIGLYGGSYGGFITLMGLFTAGETFKSGAALSSVTDWAHYEPRLYELHSEPPAG